MGQSVEASLKPVQRSISVSECRQVPGRHHEMGTALDHGAGQSSQSTRSWGHLPGTITVMVLCRLHRPVVHSSRCWEAGPCSPAVPVTRGHRGDGVQPHHVGKQHNMAPLRSADAGRHMNLSVDTAALCSEPRRIPDPDTVMRWDEAIHRGKSQGQKQQRNFPTLPSLEILLEMCNGKQFCFLKGQAAIKWNGAVSLSVLMELILGSFTPLVTET
ncbi:unnamed protein product [Pleuronectes platessa]|uniref:Uncharacterized protein n=1 Tax=Pleuronectes platessa TaxID=8262 RepID=A0A9N7VZB5_PLEPL|nr:unnamed protein product [Pleuronectes platessa]